MTVTDPSGGSLGSAGPGRPTGPADAMSAHLARNWWALALRGVLAILFGVLTFASPGATMLSLALLFAAYLLADGAFGIVSGVRAARRHERWGWLVAEGVLNILTGVVAVLFPLGAVLAFVCVTAAWSILTGAAMIAAAGRLRPDHGRWWMVLGGVVSVVFGVLLVIAPLIGAVVLTWWLGGYVVAFGVLLLALASKLRGQRG